jgi:hypothetical protein
MRVTLGGAVACLALFVPAVPLAAHHSFDAEYDKDKPITLTGVVTKLEWMNPHARFYVDVKEADGSVTQWNLELGSPASLIRRGWTRHSLKVGDQVKVNASLAKDGSKFANVRTVVLPDGRSVFGASSGDKPADKE